jgi:hypothetical protein
MVDHFVTVSLLDALFDVLDLPLQERLGMVFLSPVRSCIPLDFVLSHAPDCTPDRWSAGPFSRLSFVLCGRILIT